MHENFIALDVEKRDRIINEAMREFSVRGYKNASTNEIVRKAGISKGALFHYFASKKELFEFLYHYGVGFMMDAIEPGICDMPSDVFERWIEFSRLKLKVAAQHPDLADFMQKAFQDDAPEARTLLKDEFSRFADNFSQKIYRGIDFSKFRQGVDVQKALQIIWWVLEGYALSKQKQMVDLARLRGEEGFDALILEMESYLDMLRVSFYKEECQA